MSATETIDVVVNSTEVRSVSDITTIIASKTKSFARKYGVEDQFDEARLERDVSYLLVKSKTVGVEEFEISILGDGSTAVGGTITGKRIADLIFRIRYANGRRGF
ncbi:MAG: hypothetical protein QXW91_00855 [Candidatus Nitrosotenuis sp.]